AVSEIQPRVLSWLPRCPGIEPHLMPPPNQAQRMLRAARMQEQHARPDALLERQVRNRGTELLRTVDLGGAELELEQAGAQVVVPGQLRGTGGLRGHLLSVGVHEFAAELAFGAVVVVRTARQAQ